MEVLFFIIFITMLCVFIGYAIKLHREDKKILKELQDHEKKDKVRYQIKRQDGYWAGAIYQKKKWVFSSVSTRLLKVIKALIKWKPRR